MFLAAQFDKYKKCNYTMSAANRKKTKSFRKVGGRGIELLKKQREKQMNNQDYIRYIFWIVLAVIVVYTLSGS
jgi:hypothetical protein